MTVSFKKQRILDNAAKIMSQKGKNSTIAEIASASGITDSVIYHHFKNKEDLLCYAAGEHLKIGLKELRQQLRGIRDPISRLSKFIWFQLFYHDTNPQYANFTIFECRSKTKFFQHEIFEYFRQWTRILREILEDGVGERLFPENLNVFVLRDMILGLIDIENIMFFTGHSNKQAQTDLDEILDLLLPILSAPPPKKSRKSKLILEAAETVFAEKGYDKATISEISGAANVAEGTLYDYFKNKEDLLHSVFQYRFGEHIDSLDELFEIKTPLRKLKRFMRYYFSIYLNQPSFVKTFILNGIFNRRFYQSPAYTDFQKYMDTLDNILEQGKKEGQIRSSVSNRIFKNLFIGSFSHLALRWLFLENTQQIDKTIEINAVIELLVKAVSISSLE